MAGRFNFIGELGFPESDKSSWLREAKTKNGNAYMSIRAKVKAGVNTVFLELFGTQGDKIKTYDADKNKIEISWNDRLTKSVIDMVATWKQLRINNGDEKNTFITEWDAINYIKGHKADLDGKKVLITGQINKNIYNGDVTDRYVIQNLYVLDADDDRKPSLKVTTTAWFNKESIDDADWKKEKKLNIKFYTYDWSSETKENRYFALPTIFDCTKIDFNNDAHINAVRYKLAQIKCDYEGGNIVNNIKPKTMYKIPVELLLHNGAKEIEFDESQLSENQKRAIALGVKTLDDFRPKGSIYGEFESYYNLVNYDLRDEFDNGAVIDKISEEDFTKEIYGNYDKSEVNDDFMSIPESIEDEDLFSGV